MPIKIYADGADLAKMRELANDERIKGFTTNPTLLKKAGVTDYVAFAREALAVASGRPVSFEVLADDFEEMGRQALVIASWGEGAWVKIPVTNTRGESSYDLISKLSVAGVRLNVTAVFTSHQVEEVGRALASGSAPAVVSVFAGRIADTGRDAGAHVLVSRKELGFACPRAEMLWASPRQVYDYVLAERAGCEIITMTPDLIAKLVLLGKSLRDYSLETVAMFYRDAQGVGLTL